MKKQILAILLVRVFVLSHAKADVIADWTFQTSASTNNIIGAGLTPATTQSGVLADIGAGTASAKHASSSAWSIPAGNGSANSWSVNTWTVGDYFQFQVNASAFQNITVSFDQTGSSTGPRDFGLYYSTDGTSFTQFGANYTLLVNGSPNAPWNGTTANPIFSYSFDLSTITALNNSSADYFRLVDQTTTSIGNGTVGTGGTDRVDNFEVNGVSSVPEPSSLAIGTVCGIGFLMTLRRRN